MASLKKTARNITAAVPAAEPAAAAEVVVSPVARAGGTRRSWWEGDMCGGPRGVRL